jgi:hypothetical protein
LSYQQSPKVYGNILYGRIFFHLILKIYPTAMLIQKPLFRGKKISNKFLHTFVAKARFWDWSHYGNLLIAFKLNLIFNGENFSFLIIFLSKSLYKVKYRKNRFLEVLPSGWFHVSQESDQKIQLTWLLIICCCMKNFKIVRIEM